MTNFKKLLIHWLSTLSPFTISSNLRHLGPKGFRLTHCLKKLKDSLNSYKDSGDRRWWQVWDVGYMLVEIRSFLFPTSFKSLNTVILKDSVIRISQTFMHTLTSDKYQLHNLFNRYWRAIINDLIRKIKDKR